MKVLNLEIERNGLTLTKVSETRQRLALNTIKGNGYAIYRDTNKDNEIYYANWKRGLLEGKELEEVKKYFKP